MDIKSMIEFIKETSKEKGVSVTEMASYLKVSRVSVYKVYSCKGKIDINLVIGMLDRLGFEFLVMVKK